MEVHIACPLAATSLFWQPRADRWVQTVVCKATFRLAPDTAPLADVQEGPNDDDNYWDDDLAKSVRATCDMIPFKPRADVLLVGSAFAPGAQPASSLFVRLLVGDVDKAIAVHGDRTWTIDGRLRAASSFSKMPLRWERAAGGPDTSNPLGVAPGSRNAYGEASLPNLLPVDCAPGRPDDVLPIVGFGPIAARWPSRRDKVGARAGAFSYRSVTAAPLPPDFDASFFQSAPLDQQRGEFQPDERIILENLHAQHPRLITRLPGIRPRVWIERPGAAAAELPVRADTLWIDTDRALCTLTFRGQIPLSALQEAGLVRITMEGEAGRGEAANANQDTVETLLLLGAPAEKRPFRETANAPDPARRAEQSAAMQVGGALPAQWAYPGAAPPGRPLDAPSTPSSGVVGASMPVAATLVDPMLPSAPSANVPSPPPAFSRPAFLDEKDSRQPTPVEPRDQGPLASALSSSREIPVSGRLSAAALSDAAARVQREVVANEPSRAGSSQANSRRTVDATEAHDLVWFEPGAERTLRKVTEFRRIMLESDLSSTSPEENGDAASEELESPQEAERRHVAEVLARANVRRADEIYAGAKSAVRPGGRYEAPIVLVAGSLEPCFDEIESLRATVAAAAPLSSTDKRMKEALDAAQEALSAKWMERSWPVAEEYTSRILEAFAVVRKEVLVPGKRAVPVDFVRTRAERILVLGRHYQKRIVLGQPCLRGHIRFAGSDERLVAYMSEAAAAKLPLTASFQARALAEVVRRVDPSDGQKLAARLIAIGVVQEL